MTAATATPPVPIAPTEHGSLWQALLAARKQFPRIGKGNTAEVPTKAGGKYSYTYADLADVLDAVVPILTAHGLLWTARPTVEPGVGYVLRYELVHAPTGQTEPGQYPLPDPTRASAQEVGSAITYARRYALVAQLNLVVDDDDDAAAANARPATDPMREQPAKLTRAAPEQRQERADFYRDRAKEARRKAAVMAAGRGASEEGVLDVEVDWNGEPMQLEHALRARMTWIEQNP